MEYYLNAYINYYDCFNAHIMVRIKGLDRVLGRVIGRDLGKEVSRDGMKSPSGEDSPHPHIVAPVVEDVHHIDHADDEVYEQPEEAVANDVATDAEGVFHSFEPLHVDDVVFLLFELLEVSAKEARAETSGSYAWEAVALVHMYDNLNDASKNKTKQLVGYITLLQCWIYEHFPFVDSIVAAEDYDERKPRACRWKSRKALPISTYHMRLDRLMSDVTIPPHPAAHSLYIQDINDIWIQFFEYIALTGQICVVPDQCSLDYMDWLYLISHPFMSPTQPEDPPGHLPVKHHDTFVEPDVAQHLVATMTMDEAPEDAHVDVEQPRHAVEACQAIAKRLERLLNLRIVTKGIEAYIVAEECLIITRGVTAQRNVYVHSRRRWHMEDA
ncbi:Protein MAIN-LIKE 2 [Glycine soja]